METQAFIQYLLEQDCHLDDELETPDHYVVVNSISKKIAPLSKDAYVSTHTAIVISIVLNIRCHNDFEDYEAVFVAHEQDKKLGYGYRQN